MSTNDGGPAFPNPSGDDRDNNGMTLRDWPAGNTAVAIVGKCGSMAMTASERRAIASEAYALADEMLRARERRAE